VINPWFMTAFFGTAALCVALVVAAWRQWDDPHSLLWVAGALFYLLGTIGVTMVCNVPRNDALAAVSPTSGDGEAVWRSYLSRWTMWNHVRTFAALVAAAVFTLALR
jgi:uncharacterized membrane protein